MILAIILGFGSALKAQSISRESISVAGSYTKIENAHISFTVGEMIVGTQRSGDLILTQGFEQGKLVVEPAFASRNTELEVVAYPNPTPDVVTLSLKNYQGGDLYYAVFSGAGLPLINSQEPMDSFTNEAQIDLRSLKAGLYYLKITTEDERLVKSMKIFKLE